MTVTKRIDDIGPTRRDLVLLELVLLLAESESRGS